MRCSLQSEVCVRAELNSLRALGPKYLAPTPLPTPDAAVRIPKLVQFQFTGPAGEGLGHTTVDLKASGWDTKTHPLITSEGDSNGDGKPDLFTTSHDTDKGLYFYPSITSTGIGTPTVVGTTGWLNFQALS